MGWDGTGQLTPARRSHKLHVLISLNGYTDDARTELLVSPERPQPRLCAHVACSMQHATWNAPRGAHSAPRGRTLRATWALPWLCGCMERSPGAILRCGRPLHAARCCTMHGAHSVLRNMLHGVRPQSAILPIFGGTARRAAAAHGPRRCQVPRLAPVQGSFLGYMGSLGGEFSEYERTRAQQCRRSASRSIGSSSRYPTR